jgi:hypothetical protein
MEFFSRFSLLWDVIPKNHPLYVGAIQDLRLKRVKYGEDFRKDARNKKWAK